MRAKGLWLLLALAACKAPPVEEEPATASRAEVTHALHQQWELVCERLDLLATADPEEVRAEQLQLVRLAAEIAVRIVRVDPHADVDALVFQMSAYD
ncbi:MAG: hypothetical protein ACYTHK_11645 [Planctomycetota bacterium]|jgi:hypothetical protein